MLHAYELDFIHPITKERINVIGEFHKDFNNALNKTNTDRSFIIDDVMKKLVAYFDKTNLDFFSTETGGKQPDLELRQLGVVYRHSPNEVPTMELNSDETVWSEEERESYIGQMKRFATNGYADCENGIFYTYVYGWFNKEKEDYEHIFFISNDAEPKSRSSHYKTLIQKLYITRSQFNHFFNYKFSIYYAPQLSSVLDFLDVIPKEVVAEKLKDWVAFNSQQFIAGYDASKNKDKYTTRYPNLPQDRQSNEFKEVVTQNSLNLIYKAFMRSLGNYLLGSPAKNKTMLKVMAEYLYELYLDDFNIILMEEYDRVQKSEYARSFETKRNIPTKIQAAMDSTKFLDYGFGFVEFDEQFDLEKLPDIEEQWGLIYKSLPHSEYKPELRFRKIEHRKAHGVYFPAFDCITISVRNVNSMLHEYGHHIDFTYDKDQNLSMSGEFRPLLKGYQKNLSDGGVYKGSMLNYFLTPTEVFARAFEIYCVTVLPRVSFTESLADYDNKFEYLWLINHTEEVLNYFDTKFPHIREEVANIKQNERPSSNLTNLTEGAKEEELAPNQVKADGFTVTIEEGPGKSELEGKELIPVGRDLNGEMMHEIVEKPSKQAANLYNGISISDEILEDNCLTDFAFLLDPVSFSDGTKFGGVAYLAKESKGVIYHTFRANDREFATIENFITVLHEDNEYSAEKSYMIVGDLLHSKIKKYGISVQSLTKGIASLRFADFKNKDFGLTEEYQVHQANRLFGDLAKSYATYLEKLSHKVDEIELKALFKQKAHEEIAKDSDISRDAWNFDSVVSEFDEALFVEQLPNNKAWVKRKAKLLSELFIYLYPDLGGSHADYMSGAVYKALVENDLSVSLYLTGELRELVKAKVSESALNPSRAFSDLANLGLDLTVEV